MKAIQTSRICSVAFAGAVLFGCEIQDRDIVRADGEIFESVVRTQLPDSVEHSPFPDQTAIVQFDERPAGDNSTLANAPPVDLTAAPNPDSLSRGGLEAIVKQRTRILKDLGMRTGRPFYYPDCGGSRPHLVPDSAGTQVPPYGVAPLNPQSDKINVLPRPTCPSFVQRYVTVGLPYRGASPILEKVRPPQTPPPDTTAEMWTVYVTESSVGPGGQQYRQYVELYRRDPASGRLGVAERFLLSWAE